jgi:hypothetical protein
VAVLALNDSRLVEFQQTMIKIASDLTEETQRQVQEYQQGHKWPKDAEQYQHDKARADAFNNASGAFYHRLDELRRLHV